MITNRDSCILNGGSGAWAFEPLALQLSSILHIDVATKPRALNYLLSVEDEAILEGLQSFIPLRAIRLASDKRLLAGVFNDCRVAIPETHLIETYQQVIDFVRQRSNDEWCLKYPTSCGANGHRLINETTSEPANWPRPFVVQEFVRMECPQVYRTYCAGGEMFGWVARRFPEGVKSSPWVAHARGARYVRLDQAPADALRAARGAFVATDLWESFGCVDLLQKPSGEWVVLEVGTDGLFNHVDREIGEPGFEQELSERIANSFWKAAERL